MADTIGNLLKQKSKDKKRKHNICISLNLKVDEELRKIAEQECCGFATLVRNIAKEYLKKQRGL